MGERKEETKDRGMMSAFKEEGRRKHHLPLGKREGDKEERIDGGLMGRAEKIGSMGRMVNREETVERACYGETERANQKDMYYMIWECKGWER